MKKLLFLIIAIFFLQAPSSEAAEGDLVWSRDINNGIRCHDNASTNQFWGCMGYPMTVGTDGNIYLAGLLGDYSAPDQYFHILKYDSSGVEKFNVTLPVERMSIAPFYNMQPVLFDIGTDETSIYLVGSYWNTVPGPTDGLWYVIKLSKVDGGLVWYKKHNPAVGFIPTAGGPLPRFDVARSVYADTDGLFVLGDYNLYGYNGTYMCGLSPCDAMAAGEGAATYKLDSNGNEIWSDKWTANNASWSNMTMVSDLVSDGVSLYISGHKRMSSETYLEKRDKNGNLIWRRNDNAGIVPLENYRTGHHFIGYDPLTNSLYRTFFSGLLNKNVLQKLNTDGDVLLNTTVDFGPESGVFWDQVSGLSIAGDSIILSTYQVIAKFDKNTNLVWAKKKTPTTPWDGFQDVVGVGYDGIYISQIKYNSDGTFDNTLKKYGFSSGSCGTVTDVDGNTYETVIIGTQCWMKENMRVGSRVNLTAGQSDNGILEKFCYNNDINNCMTTDNPNYPDGGLYNIAEAMQYSTMEGVQGICPVGWHIPTDAEWHMLENYLTDAGQTCDPNRYWSFDCSSAGTKLAPNGSSGFEGNYAGRANIGPGTFLDRGTAGFYVGSTNVVPFSVRVLRLLNTSFPTVSRGGLIVGTGNDVLSVRCIQGAGAVMPPVLSLCTTAGIPIASASVTPYGRSLFVGDTEQLNAFYDTTPNICTDSAPIADANWADNATSAVVSLAGANASPQIVTTGTTGVERVTVTKGTDTILLDYAVSPNCVSSCTAARRADVCAGESFPETNSCGTPETCTGTSYCDFNWKEVAPGR